MSKDWEIESLLRLSHKTEIKSLLRLSHKTWRLSQDILSQ